MWLTLIKNATKCNRTCVKASFSTASEEIEIPKRIPRGPTDILKALANTVGRDPTAAHYKFHDDPYLIPYSNPSKRSYALSQESGRKAAQWIRQQHADLFQHKVADPPVKAFFPKPVYNEESSVNEDILKDLINTSCTHDAITVYNLLKKNKIDIQNDIKQRLLELVCYYNCDDPPNEDWIEERWFTQRNTAGKIKNTWKANGFAEELFKEIIDSKNEGDNSAAYCTLLCGMFKHGQVDLGWKKFLEAKENGVIFNLEVYNLILSKCIWLKEGHNLIWDLVQELVMEMTSKGIQPNLGTMNSILETLSCMATHSNSRRYALKVLSEFKQIGIQPSLATFYHLINIFHRNLNQVSGVIQQILNITEGVQYEIKDPQDVLFFVRAMEIIKNLNNKQLAYKLDQFLHTADNYNLIGDSYKESQYYRHFFTIICSMEPLDTFMEFYEKLVPNIYIPEPKIMEQIISAVDQQMGWKYVRKIWADLLSFEQSERQILLEKLLEVIVNCTDTEYLEDFAKIGWEIWERIEGQKWISAEWTYPMLSNLLFILLQVDELSKSHLVIDMIIRSQGTLVGEPKVSVLQFYIENCIKHNSASAAIKCIGYCNDMGFVETEALAAKINSSLSLTNQQLEKLKSIVGENCLEKEEIAAQNKQQCNKSS